MKPRCTEKTEMETIAMPEPLVSIIVPAYNAAGCIARCVESIVSQSYQELEILLLNDGSRDDTLAICRKLAEERGLWLVCVDERSVGGEHVSSTVIRNLLACGRQDEAERLAGHALRPGNESNDLP